MLKTIKRSEIILITHNPEIATLGDRRINLIDGKVDFDSFKNR